jgi:hypothetical protein
MHNKFESTLQYTVLPTTQYCEYIHTLLQFSV